MDALPDSADDAGMVDPLWQNVLFLVLGWVLGLLASMILDEIKRCRDRRDIAGCLRPGAEIAL